MGSIHPKVAAGAVGTWISIIAAWLLNSYAHVTPPPEVTVAAAGLISFVIAYFVPGSASEASGAGVPPAPAGGTGNPAGAPTAVPPQL